FVDRFEILLLGDRDLAERFVDPRLLIAIPGRVARPREFVEERAGASGIAGDRVQPRQIRVVPVDVWKRCQRMRGERGIEPGGSVIRLRSKPGLERNELRRVRDRRRRASLLPGFDLKLSVATLGLGETTVQRGELEGGVRNRRACIERAGRCRVETVDQMLRAVVVSRVVPYLDKVPRVGRAVRYAL